MGKHERATALEHAGSSSIAPDERYRRRMWGLFHVLNYHQWRYIKRRLHHRRHGSDKHSAEKGDRGSSSAAGLSEKLSKLANDSEEGSSNNSRKRERRTEASKNSMKVRIKSLIISDDKFRHKGRHQRTSTAPAPLQSIQINGDLLATPTTDVSPTTLLKHTSSELSDSSEAPLISKTALDSHIDQHQVDHHEKQPITHARNVEESSEQHNDLNSPDYPSMNSIDNLDVVEGINKELLLKFIRDAGAFSAQRRKEHKEKGRFQRSGTFPFPSLHIGNASEENPPAHKKEEPSPGSEERNLQDGNQIMSSAEAELLGNIRQEMDLEAETSMSPHHNTNTAAYSPVVAGNVRNHGKNQAVSKHFKALKRKIQHVVKINRKEKNRIAMDGILHRIPSDKEFSGDLMEEMIRKWKEVAGSRSDPTGQDDNKLSTTSRPRSMARSPSLETSLHKYAQLFESSFGTEAKCHDSSMFPTSSSHIAKKLARIASSPDIKLQSASAGNDPKTLSSRKQPLEESKIDDDIVVEDEYSRLTPNVGSENQPTVHAAGGMVLDEQADVPGYSQETDYGVEVSTSGENLDEREISSPLEHELFELPTTHEELSLEHEHSRGSSLFDIPQDDTDIDTNFGYLEEQERAGIDTNLGSDEEREFSNKALEDFINAQSQFKDREFFNYVRYVLEISGLSRKESLGSLPPNNQPLDRAIYDEVEDIWVHDPVSINNEEGSGNYDHVLLFDLINEVLLEIYERSFTYYPKTLSPLCRIHRMPGGYRVLKEVWTTISRYMSIEASLDQTMDYVTCKDMEKEDNWMNLQCDSEGVGIELEDMMLDDLLDEMIFE